MCRSHPGTRAELIRGVLLMGIEFFGLVIFGRGASGGGWLVANACVRASPITMGAQIDTPERRPPSRSQSAWASLKYSCARC